jgi:fibronectin-binding autotransporter adhesin
MIIRKQANKMNSVTSRVLVMGLTLMWGLLAAMPPNAQAATYTYTPTNSATESWSSGANWSAVPASASDTILTFMGANSTVLPNSTANSNNNDVANPFNLNVLNLQGTGPASGAGNVTIGGTALRFVNNGSSTPVMNLNALAGTAGLTNTITAPITLATNITVTGDGTAAFVLGGAITGSGAITKYGASTLQLNGDSSSTFSGPINLRGGTLTINGSRGGKLPATQVVNFDGVSSTLYHNTGTNTFGEVNYQRGSAVIYNKYSAGNVWTTINGARTRATGATVSYTYDGGSPPGNNKIVLSGQATGFIDGSTFSGTGVAFYDTPGYVRGINYTTDTIAQYVNGDFTAISDIGNTIGLVNKHTQITNTAGTATTANGAGSGTSLTLTDASNFQVGQTLSGNTIPKGTYITAKAGNTLTLSQANAATNGATITPYSGINNQSTITLNTLRFGNTAPGSLRLAAGQTLTLSDGTIITDGNLTAAAFVISGGTGIQAGLNKELVISGNGQNNMLVIASPILANGVNALVRNGPTTSTSTLRLEGANTFTGGVYLNGNSIQLASAETPGVSGPLGASGTIYFYGGQLITTAANTYDYSPRFATTPNQNFSVDTSYGAVTWTANLVSDNGTLTYQTPRGAGSGSLTLTGTNTYSGGTTVAGLTLILGSDSALGTGPVTFNYAASTYVHNNSAAATRTLSNALAINTTFGLYFGVQDNSNIGNLVFTGPVTLGTNATLLAGSQSSSVGQTAVAFEGAIGDNGAGCALSASGGGTGAGYVFLLGTNTYSGQTTVGASATATLIIDSLGNAGVAGSLGAPTGANATIRVSAGGAATLAQGTLRYIGGTTSTDRTIDMGSNATTVNATLDASGSGPITFTGIAASGSSGGSTRGLYLTGVNTDANTISGAIPAGYNGSMNVIKNGNGTWILSGANAFTNLTVNAGQLVLDYSTTTVLNATNSLILGGGTLEFKGKSGAFSTSAVSSNVTVSALTGLSTIQVNKNGGIGTAVTLGTVTVNTGGALLFDLGDSANSVSIATNLSTVTNGRILIKDGVGRVDYARNSGANTAISALTATTDLVANPAANTAYRLTSDFTITGNTSPCRTLRIDPSANNQTLTLAQGAAAGATKVQSILMVGAHDFTVTLASGKTGPLNVDGAGNSAAPAIHHQGTGKLTLDVKLGAGNGAFEFFGAGLVDWTRPANASGTATIGGGVLRQAGTNGVLLDATASGSGSGNIILAGGGVLEISDATNITRNVGTGSGAIKWIGDGGFSAFGATRAVSLASGTALVWGSGSFVPANNALVLGSPYATGTLDFQNGIDLGSFQRVVDVKNGSATVDGRLSGVLTSRYGGGLIKRGAGTLELTGANTYQGDTWVEGGELKVSGSTGSGLVTVSSGASINGTGTVNRLTLNTGGKLLVADATKPLTVTGVMNISNGTLDLAGLGTLPGGDLAIVQCGSIIGSSFGSVINTPPGRDVQVVGTTISLNDTSTQGSIISFR